MEVHAYCTMKNGEPQFVETWYRPFTFGIMCRKDEMVYSITFEKGMLEDYDMVGYENNNSVSYIHKTPLQVSACFQYGVNKYIEKHGGRIVYLKIKEVSECSPAGELAEHRAEWDRQI